MEKITVAGLVKMKSKGIKIAKVNLYDYPLAVLADKAGIDMIMVGDSVGTVALGYDTTNMVTLDDMIHHAKAVAKGAKHAFVLVDMPFISYDIGVDEAVMNAGRLMRESGADGLKLEGGREISQVVGAITNAGIPVVGHIGMITKIIRRYGFKVQGKDALSARQLLEDAKALEEAGAFMIVLECISSEVAREITTTLRIPTLSTGSGPYCDGVTMNVYDMLGLAFNPDKPDFAKQYVNLGELILRVVKTYIEEVRSGRFVSDDRSFHMAEGEAEKLSRVRKLKSYKGMKT